jgi:hypothetical protein
MMIAFSVSMIDIIPALKHMYNNKAHLCIKKINRSVLMVPAEDMK